MRRIFPAMCCVVAMSTMACGPATGQVRDDERILSNSIGIRFVLIPAGTFMMGSHEPAESVAANPVYSDAPGQVKWFQDEHPLHRVTISRPFYLQETEVTLGQFRRFVSDTGFRTESEKEGWGRARDGKKDHPGWVKKEGVNWQAPGFSQSDNEPVVYISRNDAEAFVKWLNNKENTDRYSLPTEAQWEYACRAGTETPYYWGMLPDGGKANFADGSYSRASPNDKYVNRNQEDGQVHTAPVARYPANPFGLYDMSGNAFEWCKDWFGEYSAAPVSDPRGPAEGKKGVLRGGAWNSSAMAVRSAGRSGFDPGNRDNFTGFRVARTY
jgi:sulfatase modifying factor 1